MAGIYMRILHTADWHLGHNLRDHARTAEHAYFLNWLVATVVERRVDVVMIAGDVFDGANPPPVAWRMWFEFLGQLKQAQPKVQVVVIAGNHDSAQRMEAPRELLAAFDVRVVGQLQRDGDGKLRTKDIIVPLRDASGAVVAQCVAVPFLRASDVLGLAPVSVEEPEPDGEDYVLPQPGEVDERVDPLIAGMRTLHEELFTDARAQLQPGQALVAMAHGYLVGGALSELSERKVLGGNQHALPIDLFPDDCRYVALGHLHRPQPLGGHDHIRYSGSPIPLSMPERLHAHHVVFCDLEGDGVEKIWSLRTPRLVDLARIPERGELDPDAALAAVEALEERDESISADLLPLVEVAIRLSQPSPSIAERIARAIADKHARLVRVEVVLADGPRSAPRAPRDLASLSAEQVFVRRYHRDFEGDVPKPLLSAFRELLEEVEHDDGGHA
ncbi:MAG: exonuclease SbcD [Planctomycetota bacterium]|jgi:exonuclease SbcD